MSKFLEELKRRNVIKSTIAYLVVAWVLLQVFTVLLPIINAADWVLKGLTLLLVIGLPIWIIVSWIYDITPQGVEKTTKKLENELVTQATNKRLNVFIIVSLSIAVVVMGLKLSNVFDSDSDNQYAIAVLPFVNMSDDPEQEYFSDGISEEIINMLAQVPKLKVMGRTSSFAFKGKNMDLKLIGEQLNVNYLLEGSVRKSGNTLRITAQLINVADGSHLYSDTFDRELVDIFDIQDEISVEILDAIKIKLFGEEKEAVFKKYTDNVEAYQLYLKGKFFYNQYSKEGFLKAIEYFKKAIEIEPNYAIAYAEMGFCYLTLATWWLPVDQNLPQARKAIERSIQLDDQIAESHLNVGRLMLHWDWNIRDAIIEFKKALEINPNNPDAYVQLSMAAGLLGNKEEANTYANKAISLDPFSVMNLFMAAVGPTVVGDNAPALEIANQLIDLAPNFYGGYYMAGVNYMNLGKFEEGLNAYQTAASFGNEPNALAQLGITYGLMGEKDKAMGIIERIKKIEDIELFGNNFIADVYLGMGDLDTAFMYYDKAIENREGVMIWKLGMFRTVPGLLEDPRMVKLIEKMGVIYYK